MMYLNSKVKYNRAYEESPLKHLVRNIVLLPTVSVSVGGGMDSFVVFIVAFCESESSRGSLRFVSS